jgi:hypothetical protein
VSPFEHSIVMISLAQLAVVSLAFGGFYLSVTRFGRHRVAGYVCSVTATLAVAIVFSANLHQTWQARRDSEQRVWAARSQHLHRLQILLRAESASLTGIAQALHEGRYFTLIADDARHAVWQDGPLTPDVERHFPEYFGERERLIHDILDYDREVGRLRQMVSASLPLTGAAEPYRKMLVPALVSKCGGVSDGSADRLSAVRDALGAYDQYLCTADLTGLSQMLFDRAADLADAASRASEAAGRYAEETVLRGSCTYAPPEP